MKFVLDESLFEAVDDEVIDSEVIPETEEQTENTGETQQDYEKVNIKGFASDMLKKEMDTIDSYDGFIGLIESEFSDRQDILGVLEGILIDENNHLGQLQAIINSYSEESEAAAQEEGEASAEAALNGEDTEEITVETDDGLEEDIEQKSNGKWANVGKDGEHGEFKTKKAARAQQKAMFANGYHEDLNTETDMHDRVAAYKKDKGCCGEKRDDTEVTDELEQPVNANAEVLTEETTEDASEDNRVEKYFNTVSTSLCSMLGRWLRQHGYKLSGDCAAMIWDQFRRKENLGGDVVVDVNINTDKPLSAEDESSLRNVVGEWCDKMCNKDDATCYDYCCAPEITDNGTGGVKLRLSFLDDDGAIVEFD